jgi:hypothetical protein
MVRTYLEADGEGARHHTQLSHVCDAEVVVACTAPPVLSV